MLTDEDKQSNAVEPIEEEQKKLISTHKTEDMEVHYHPHLSHGHQKKFRQYFSEFLMIFLAVTMGFISENLREHFAENHKEKEYVRSFLSDIEKDTVNLHNVLLVDKGIIKGLDSIINLSYKDMALNNHRRELYRLSAKYFNNYTDFLANDITMQQVKFAEDIRIFRHKHLANSLVTNYTMLTQNLGQQKINIGMFMDLYQTLKELFDFNRLYNSRYTDPGSTINWIY